MGRKIFLAIAIFLLGIGIYAMIKTAFFPERLCEFRSFNSPVSKTCQCKGKIVKIQDDIQTGGFYKTNCQGEIELATCKETRLNNNSTSYEVVISCPKYLQ